MEVKRPFSGRSGVSLPFTDHCKPIGSSNSELELTLKTAITLGKTFGWKYLDFRGNGSCFQHAPPFTSYYNHILSLSQHEQEIFSSFRDSTIRHVKKAIKSGVSIRNSHSLRSVKKFYRLHCFTRKRHGLPPQPFQFFRNIYQHIIAHQKGQIFLASHAENEIAGAIFFHFGRKAIFKYGASDKKYYDLRSNNLLMSEAINWYANRGYESMDFGRTDLSNNGLLQFKRGWGTTEQKINYYRFDTKKDDFVQHFLVSEHHQYIFKYLPSILSRVVAKALYKYAA
jgi:lipid II:glycine glycyltransferase (peptidoglycan interpeptide bridge formation enzyme)